MAMVVESVATSLRELSSRPNTATLVLMRPATVAFTAMVNWALAPAGTGLFVVQPGVAAMQVQPKGPVRLVTVRLLGSATDHVVTPLVGPAPTLLTVTVYEPGCPATRGPARVMAIVGSGVANAQTAPKVDYAPKPPGSPSKALLDNWNEIGRKLIAMAEDFPEDKYDFKPNPVQRSFAEQLLHAADSIYFFINPVIGVKPPALEDRNDPEVQGAYYIFSGRGSIHENRVFEEGF